MMSIARRCLVVAGGFRVVHVEQAARKKGIGTGRGRSVPG
jgi:hypothetical protein